MLDQEFASFWIAAVIRWAKTCTPGKGAWVVESPKNKLSPRTMSVLRMFCALWVLGLAPNCLGAHWAHSWQLDPHVHLAWTPSHRHITFELRARTRGYVALGFSQDGTMRDADIVVAWVHDGHLVLQDRWSSGHSEPVLDESQDYEPLLGYENGTHTVVRFRRRLDTCDPKDWTITNSTTRVLWAYSNSEPAHPNQPLLYHGAEQRGSRSLFLVDGGADITAGGPVPDLRSWDLLHHQISLNEYEELRWCKIFKLPSDIRRKHHLIRLEPVLGSAGPLGPLRRALVYECQGDVAELEAHAHARGHPCSHPRAYECTAIVASWASGSQGLVYPPEAGYPLDPNRGPTYLMLEGHYSTLTGTGVASPFSATDRAGLRLFYTGSLRPHDASILTVGIEPNWRHIIPPGQAEVVSQGHCIGQCTRETIPPRGITVFALAMHTHLIGTKVRLRHIRNGTELSPLAEDDNYDPGFQEYRLLYPSRIILPGDHLIAECAYNSESRDSITLGGLSGRDETCLVDILYYPKMALSVCHSLPSLPTVLRSLGIHELVPGSSPVMIKAPVELADTTLEARLVTYDWESNFEAFDRATRRGSFKPVCWAGRPASLLPGTESLEVYDTAISPAWSSTPESSCGLENIHEIDVADESDSTKRYKDSRVRDQEDVDQNVVTWRESSRLNAANAPRLPSPRLWWLLLLVGALLRPC